MGVKVVGDSIVTTVKGGEEVPLVPSNAGHAFEKRIDIDPDSDLLPVVHDAGMETSPTGAKGAKRVAGNIDEETECGREAVEHGGQFYRSRRVEAGRADRYRYRNRYRYRKTQRELDRSIAIPIVIAIATKHPGTGTDTETGTGKG